MNNKNKVDIKLHNFYINYTFKCLPYFLQKSEKCELHIF